MTADYPVVDVDAVGWLSETQMIEVDRVMVEDLGIQMMENAGGNLAQLVVDHFGPGSVTVHPEPRSADVVIDALIGSSLKGAPRGRTRELIGIGPTPDFSHSSIVHVVNSEESSST